MALRDRAVLVLENDGRTGEFHFVGCEPNEEFTREFLVGNRGQAIRNALDVIPGTDGESGEGFFLDGGQGVDTITLSFEGGWDGETYNDTALQWGDGSSGTDRWDATGAHPDTQAQVLKWWVRNATTDSFRTPAYLHWGEWTDGSINGSTGIFGEPVSVVVNSVRAERSDRKPSSFEGTVELIRASTLAELAEDSETHPSSIPDY